MAHSSMAANGFDALCARDLHTIFAFVGLAPHVRLCAVSKDFYDMNSSQCKSSHQATFKSAARLELALECGLQLNARPFDAGWGASVQVLQAAQTRGLNLTDAVLDGAARSGCLPKLRWLVEAKQLKLRRSTMEAAARGGSVGMFKWLELHRLRSPHDSKVIEAAAAGRHCALVQYLWDRCSAVSALRLAACAAKAGSAEILQWLVAEQGLKLKEAYMTAAVEGGHHALMSWLVEHGLATTARHRGKAVRYAATCGDLTALDWLLEHGHLALDAMLYTEIILAGKQACAQLETMHWLWQVARCPWDAAYLAEIAATFGCLECLRFIHDNHAYFWPQEVDDQLDAAGNCGELQIAQWLLAQGARWPTDEYGRLQDLANRWYPYVAQWACSAGYAGPGPARDDLGPLLLYMPPMRQAKLPRFGSLQLDLQMLLEY